MLKPLKGLDDGLYENLVSFAAEFPQVPMSVAVCEAPFGRNPKVRTLAGLLSGARHEHILVSDSNVRVAPDYLTDTVAALADPRVGLVCNLIAGRGRRRRRLARRPRARGAARGRAGGRRHQGGVRRALGPPVARRAAGGTVMRIGRGSRLGVTA